MAGDIRTLYISVLEINNIFEQWVRKNPYFYPRNYKEFISLVKNIPVSFKRKIAPFKNTSSY